MNRIICAIAALILVLCCLPCTAVSASGAGEEPAMRVMGRTIVVNASGGGDYTRIQWAIDNASEGDTIHIKAGTYYESMTINKNLTIVGDSRDKVFINGSGFGNVINITANWVKLSSVSVISNQTTLNDIGIYVDSTDFVSIIDCNCSNNKGGIFLQYSTNALIKNNIFSFNEGAINLQYSSSNSIFNNQIVNNYNSITICYSSSNSINDNLIHSNHFDGIRVLCSSLNVITNNSIFDNNDGIELNEAHHNIISNNTICSNGRWGIELQLSAFNTISNNGISDHDWDGILISYFSCKNIIINNEIKSNLGYGIKLDDTTNNNLNNNKMINNKFNFHVEGSHINDYLHNVDSSNTVDGKPIYYWVNRHNYKIPFNAGYVGIINSTNIVISNVNISNNYRGILLAYTSNSIIENCSLSNNSIGIRCSSSNNIRITSNNISQNSVGIYCLPYSSNITIDNNNIYSNRDVGICLYSTSNNKLISNTIFNNNDYGIVLTDSSQNKIFHNSFNNNTCGGVQAKDSGTNNLWYNSNNEGNYWSDHTFSDYNSDLIIDIPYDLDGDACAKDFFPLVNPHNIIIPIANAGPDIVIDQYETVKFDSSGCVNCAFINNYTWEFVYNDKRQFLFGSTPVFSFDRAGIFIITLKVCNSIGWESDDTMNITVIDITHPIAIAGPDIETEQHTLVYLNGSFSQDNVGIVNYSWNFIYNNSEIALYGRIVQFVFHEAGTYMVTLIVTDAVGNRATDTLNVTVLDTTPPTADAGLDITINQSETVEFFFHQDSTDNVGCWSWIWRLEYNGTIQTLNHTLIMSSLPLFTFEVPGMYVVSMTVTDEEGNLGRDIMNITVLDNEPPVAFAGKDVFIDLNTTFHLDGTKSRDNVGIVNWTWKFEYDGKTIVLYAPELDFTFLIPGTYLIEMIAVDAEGNTATDWIQITVEQEIIPPEDDGISPADDDEEGRDAGSEIPPWTWILLGIFILSIGGVFVYFLRKQKEEEGEEFGEDEYGRVGKDEDGVLEQST